MECRCPPGKTPRDQHVRSPTTPPRRRRAWADRLAVVGLSGGGPYALSCAAVPARANRVAAVAVLGAVTPSVGPEATSSGGIDFLRRVIDVFSVMRRPFTAAVSAMIVPINPLGHLAQRGVSAIMPDGDKRVFADPDIEAMADDGRLVGRDWNFRLTDIAAPVRWWHGGADASRLTTPSRPQLPVQMSS